MSFFRVAGERRRPSSLSRESRSRLGWPAIVEFDLSGAGVDPTPPASYVCTISSASLPRSPRSDVTTVEILGGIEKRELIIAEYDPNWPVAYRQHESRIRVALGRVLGRKVVDRDRVLFVRKTYEGKKLTMRVTVSKVDAKTVTKKLRVAEERRSG